MRSRPFSETENPDVVFESHSHWAVGHVDGFSIRVYRDDQITDAFRVYHGLMERLDAYPVLDESDYGCREYEAALENIEDAAWRIKTSYELKDGWEAEAFEWLSAHRPGAVENKDDRGAYPSERDLQDAINASGLRPACWLSQVSVLGQTATTASTGFQFHRKETTLVSSEYLAGREQQLLRCARWLRVRLAFA